MGERSYVSNSRPSAPRSRSTPRDRPTTSRAKDSPGSRPKRHRKSRCLFPRLAGHSPARAWPERYAPTARRRKEKRRSAAGRQRAPGRKGQWLWLLDAGRFAPALAAHTTRTQTARTKPGQKYLPLFSGFFISANQLDRSLFLSKIRLRHCCWFFLVREKSPGYVPPLASDAGSASLSVFFLACQRKWLSHSTSRWFFAPSFPTERTLLCPSTHREPTSV